MNNVYLLITVFVLFVVVYYLNSNHSCSDKDDNHDKNYFDCCEYMIYDEPANDNDHTPMGENEIDDILDQEDKEIEEMFRVYGRDDSSGPIISSYTSGGGSGGGRGGGRGGFRPWRRHRYRPWRRWPRRRRYRPYRPYFWYTYPRTVLTYPLTYYTPTYTAPYQRFVIRMSDDGTPNFTVNGVEGATIPFIRGQTYEIDISTGEYPFYFYRKGEPESRLFFDPLSNGTVRVTIPDNFSTNTFYYKSTRNDIRGGTAIVS